jgi:hypothetical protein
MDGKLFVIVDHLQVLGLEYIHSLFSIFYHLLLDKFTEFTVVAPSCLENSAIVLVIPLDLVFRYVVLIVIVLIGIDAVYNLNRGTINTILK